ncbi:MAG: DNA-primase RepB domain-containing protein [Rhodospirillaceae bacterium]
MVADSDAAVEFLRVAFEPDDWIALFLKSYETGRCMQRVGPLALFREPRMHAWLRAMNAQRFNVYVSVNAIKAGVRARTKEAIGAVRHVFVEADEDGPQVVAKVSGRADLPPPSYLIHSSPSRVHVLWRAVGFSITAIERLQKHLASELGTDPAATPCSQTTRLPGYVNHKYSPGHLVTIEYETTGVRRPATAFPAPHPQPYVRRQVLPCSSSLIASERARRYLARVEPAVAGQHGDLHTFRVCCRMVRGFALSDAEAFALLTEWNARCVPPWSAQELSDKITRARKYGHEAYGALLTGIDGAGVQ